MRKKHARHYCYFSLLCHGVMVKRIIGKISGWLIECWTLLNAISAILACLFGIIKINKLDYHGRLCFVRPFRRFFLMLKRKKGVRTFEHAVHSCAVQHIICLLFVIFMMFLVRRFHQMNPIFTNEMNRKFKMDPLGVKSKI